jgi:hypothetical protein
MSIFTDKERLVIELTGAMADATFTFRAFGASAISASRQEVAELH